MMHAKKRKKGHDSMIQRLDDAKKVLGCEMLSKLLRDEPKGKRKNVKK